MTEQPPGWSTPDPRGPGSVPPALPVPPPLAAYAAPDRRRDRRVVPLRPLGLGELLDGAVSVLRRYPRPVFAAAAMVAVVGAALHLLVTLSVRGAIGTAARDASEGSGDALATLLGAAAVSGGLNLLVGTVTGAVLAGVVTAVVGRAVFGDDTTVQQAWQLLRPRLPALMGVALTVSLASSGIFLVAVGIVAAVATTSTVAAALTGVVVVPLGTAAAFWLYVRWSLAAAAVVLEKQSVQAALRRSAVLVARSFWRVAGVLLLAGLIAVFVSLVLSVPFQVAGLSTFRGFGSGSTDLSTSRVVGAAVTSAVVATVVAPFAAGVRALLYVDRRMRAEGLDVTLVAAAAARA